MSTLSPRQPTEFVAVIRLINSYAAVHQRGKRKTFVSEHPEIDIRVAQATARAFAESKNIPYREGLFELDQPLLTVLKHGQKWYPAELHPDKITLLTKLGSLCLDCPEQEGAICLTQAIAMSRRGDCIPSIGISLGSWESLSQRS